MRGPTALMIVPLGLVIAVAPVATAMAQPGGSPAPAQTAPANPSGSPGAETTPPAPSGGEQRADSPPASSVPERASDTAASQNETATDPSATSSDVSGAASPRTSPETTRVLGLPPLAAALIAGALLLAIVLIVAFSRLPRVTPIDRVRNRRR